jgi:hypothetical protein
VVIRAEIERGGQPPAVTDGLTAEAAGRLIARLAGETGVTVALSREETGERMLVAVNETYAFLGLESLDGVFQFVARDHRRDGTCPFVIGGQKTDIDARYVVALEHAAAVVQAWGDRAEDPSGDWERQ